MRLTPHRVLVVDDDPAYGRLAGLILEDELADGVEVRSVTTLGAALDDAASWEPGCVLLDLSLPDGDGLGSIVRLRAAGLLAPVLVVSGRSDEGLEQRAVEQGAEGYLLKGDELDGGLALAVATLLS